MSFERKTRLVVHLVHRIDVKMEEVRVQFIACGLRIPLRERNCSFSAVLPPEGIVTTIAAGWGRFFPSLYGFSILFGAFCYWQCRFYTFPPSPREKPLSWNGQRNTGKSLCMEIFNLQVFLHQYRGSFYIWRLVLLSTSSFVNTWTRIYEMGISDFRKSLYSH